MEMGGMVQLGLAGKNRGKLTCGLLGMAVVILLCPSKAEYLVAVPISDIGDSAIGC